MQRFPQIDENSSNDFRSYRSTDFISEKSATPIAKSATDPTPQPPKRDLSIIVNRSRSCSGGRNKTITPSVLTRKGN